VTETTRQADRHLRVKPGTDAYLLLALAAIIIGRDLGDPDFIRDKTVGYNEIKAQLAKVATMGRQKRSG
jgi:anaerobic selenocysteine-containing dehydrogenase